MGHGRCGVLTYFGERMDLEGLLKDIEEKYSDAFVERGPGVLQHFKHMIDCVDALLNLLANPEVDFRVKLIDYAKVRNDVFEFCRFYARWLGNLLMERLKYEIYELLEEAIG